MTFTEMLFYDADIQINLFSGGHNDMELFNGALEMLAHAFSPPSRQFHLDDDLTASNMVSTIYLESVVVHEIGHVCRLGHTPTEEAITKKQRKRRCDSSTVDGGMQGLKPRNFLVFHFEIEKIFRVVTIFLV
ncbi:hypothetical protein U1Q18_052616 [Sarracenia purpurea var. burkii]